jgi:hypothetical protein
MAFSTSLLVRGWKGNCGGRYAILLSLCTSYFGGGGKKLAKREFYTQSTTKETALGGVSGRGIKHLEIGQVPQATGRKRVYQHPGLEG